MHDKTDPVEIWLSTCSTNTKYVYQSYFRMFEDFTKKTGAEMLAEARKLARNPETADIYPLKLFTFYKHLLSGEVKVKVMGSTPGKKGGWSGKYKDKPLSQKTARTATTSVQSFFSFHNMPINLRKFIKKDVRMKNPKVEKRKHQLLASEIDALFRLAGLRNKAILGLGLMGQDESTIASLRVEQFEGKLEGKQLELVELLRPKTNQEILLLLTPEVQKILAAHIRTLNGNKWLFPGYNAKPMNAQLPNEVFKQLCQTANIQGNGKRLSFHCCRMWFSTQLRNRISDDIIDVLIGHKPRYGKAYLGDEVKLKELLEVSTAAQLLRLQQPEEKGLREQNEWLQKRVGMLEQNLDVIQRQKKLEISELQGRLARLEGENKGIAASLGFIKANWKPDKGLPLIDVSPIKAEQAEETKPKRDKKKETWRTRGRRGS